MTTSLCSPSWHDLPAATQCGCVLSHSGAIRREDGGRSNGPTSLAAKVERRDPVGNIGMMILKNALSNGIAVRLQEINDEDDSETPSLAAHSLVAPS